MPPHTGGIFVHEGSHCGTFLEGIESKGMKKVVVMGGGTGTYTVLTGLKKYSLELTAIVAMSDNGGSSGILRDEFGVLPPGDLRQCLVALSEAPLVMRKLFNHRYDRSDLKGHTFGNLFISTLESITGNIDRALEVAGEILKIRGRVVPVTLSKVHIVTQLHNGKVLRGEDELSRYQLVSRYGIKRMRLAPKAKANPHALHAIKDADVIVIGPGNLYASLVPNFLVPGIASAFAQSKAKKIFVTNLMSKNGHTDDFLVCDYVHVVEEAIGKRGVFDVVIYNTKQPPSALLNKYADEGEPVACGEVEKKEKRFIGVDVLANGVAKTPKKDLLRRTLIRHDPEKLAKAIMQA